MDLEVQSGQYLASEVRCYKNNNDIFKKKTLKINMQLRIKVMNPFGVE